MNKLTTIIALFLLGMISSPMLNAQDWANLSKYQHENTRLKNQAQRKNRVVFMGNSITEHWGTRNPDFFTSNAYINRGISGQVTSQMLLRFRPDVIALNPNVVVILAGTNDIAQNQGPITLEQIAGNIFSMAELAKAHNIKVVLCAALPANSYSWKPEIKPADDIIKLNKMIKKYAKQNGIVYVDYYTPMVNQEKGLRPEYGSDSVHPNFEGYKVMEPIVQKAIDKAIR